MVASDLTEPLIIVIIYFSLHMRFLFYDAWGLSLDTQIGPCVAFPQPKQIPPQPSQMEARLSGITYIRIQKHHVLIVAKWQQHLLLGIVFINLLALFFHSLFLQQ